MPFVKVWVDDPEMSLKDFDDNDLIEEIEKRGFKVFNALDGMPRIEHLIDCGFVREAISEALQLVENELNRPYTLSIAH